MRTYLTYIRTTLKLVMRDRVVLFFNYLLPLLFFVVFAQSFGASRGGALSQVIAMVLILGVLGSGFFGAGMRAVVEREQNILRRFKVAPITPLPILVSSLVTGLISYLPGAALILGIATLYYGMPWPERWISLFVLLSLGVLAFRSIGLIIGAVANSMQESQIIIQLLYLPMLFLSGATFPVSSMPKWLQIAAQFLPTPYLYTGLQGILVRGEDLAANAKSLVAMLVTVAVATFLGVRLFRWEKEEKLGRGAKLSLAAVLLPFLILGVMQSRSEENLSKSLLLMRDMRRNRPVLIRGPRILIGDGKVIEAGGVLLRNGRIVKVYASVPAEDPAVETLEASGKTLLPGFQDVRVQLLLPGGVRQNWDGFEPVDWTLRGLAAYLYSGVTAVRSVSDAQSVLVTARTRIEHGEKSGADLIITGRLFTTKGGRGTEFLRFLPENSRGLVERDTFFYPTNPEEARAQVAQLAGAAQFLHIAGALDPAIVRAIVEEARKQGIRVSMAVTDVASARVGVEAGIHLLEGMDAAVLSDDLLAEMAKRGVAYSPMLALLDPNTLQTLDASLVQQVALEGLVASTKQTLSGKFKASGDFAAAQETLRRAHRAGVPLVTGTGSGNGVLIHGPAVHREMQLWAAAGLPKPDILSAATLRAADVLGRGKLTGRIAEGFEGTLLLLDGNPLEQLNNTERISAVFLKGERINRASLFEKD
ncbi:MAG: ABC transporter permease [Bryobacterales bacterium]|nr:ABC transporter permease [Bryobacterales bacterium]